MNKFDDGNITAILHTRSFAVITTILVIVAYVVFRQSLPLGGLAENDGIALPAISGLINDSDISLTINLITVIGVAILLVYANKSLLFIRGLSFLFASMFLIINASMPLINGSFSGGTLLCLLSVIAMTILFSTFQRPEMTKQVYLIFFLLALGANFKWGLIVISAIYIIGCGQMMIFQPRTVTAALLGLITPLWILLGFGIVSFSDLSIPTSENVLKSISDNQRLLLISYCAFTGFLNIIFSLLNIIKIMSADARTRSINGFIVLLSLLTIILCCADYKNLPDYVSLLNCCTALHIGQFFAMNYTRRSYAVIIPIILVYVAFFIASALVK